MKITPTNTVGAGSVRRKSGVAKSGAGQARFTLLDEAAESAPTVPGVSPIASVDALLAVQEVGTPGSGQQHSTARGQRLLDHLDEIRMGLLRGSVARGTLVELARELDVARTEVTDPRLVEVLDEIDLRAEVELAKFGGEA